MTAERVTDLIAPEAQAVNETREQLALAIDALFGVRHTWRVRNFLEALECFINAKIRAAGGQNG